MAFNLKEMLFLLLTHVSVKATVVLLLDELLCFD